MPSGKVHDRITLLTAAAAAPVWWLACPVHRPEAFVVTASAYVFSGLWLSDDLDTNSVAYQRWGPLKFLWWPYRRCVPHRSWISHGIGVGPLLRVAYFIAVAWAAAYGILWLLVGSGIRVDRTALLDGLFRHGVAWTVSHPTVAVWAATGLILGGIAHSVADAVVSFAKRVW